MLKAIALTLLFATAPAGSPMTDGRALVRRMHDRYAGKWYDTLTFRQKTTTYAADGKESAEIWHESLACPGQLRIDIEPVADGKSIIFANDTVYRLDHGKLAGSRPLIHPLLVLGFDIYCQPPETTIDRLEKLKVDLSIIRETTYNGTPVYVVGAKDGDLKSPQFWIEKKRLIFVRMLRPEGKDGAQTSDVVFDKYVKAGGGWVAAEVLFSVDGKLETREEYTEIKTGMPLSPTLFTPPNP